MSNSKKKAARKATEFHGSHPSSSSHKRRRILAVVVVILVLAACCVWKFGGFDDRSKTAVVENPIATIVMEDGGEIVVELYPDIAPNTVANFVELANSDFYDGLIFHRVIPGFMIQGGDPEGTGAGGPGYSIKGEFTKNGFQNDLKHTRGVISMARANPYDSAGSQFFIVHADSPHLDTNYAAFGMVISGMETVDRIASVKTNPLNDKPITEQKIKSITVDTKGAKYKAEKIGG